MLKSSGIYQIRNTVNGEVYVGSATSLRRRWYEHQSCLRRGVHHAVTLQRSWKKNGEVAFVFEPLLACAKGMLLFYEQRAIDVLRPKYNMSRTAGNCLGVKHSDETRARMSAVNKGKKITPAHHAAMLAGRIGTKNTPEHNAKIAAAARGRPCSAETKAKLAAHNAGKVLPLETREKISAALRGKPHNTPSGPLSTEHKARISAAITGIRRSPETLAKMRAAASARVRAWKTAIAVFATAGFWARAAGGVI